MIIKCSCNKQDALSFTKYQLTRSTIWVVVAFLATVGLALWDVLDYGWRFSFYVIFAIAYFVMAIAIIATYIFIYQKLKKSDKVTGTQTFNYYEFTETDNFFLNKTEINGEDRGTIKVYYDQILKVIETKKYYYVFVSAQQFYLIVKADLDQEQNTFVGNILKLHTKNYKVKKF